MKYGIRNAPTTSHILLFTTQLTSLRVYTDVKEITEHEVHSRPSFHHSH